ncbi:MAG: TetR-like C-terminal domain-containing protein [Actinomycetota bacterium]
MTRAGRPLSVVVEHAVYTETLRLLADESGTALHRQSIADGAQVSRQTLYNRWPTVGDIVLDALSDRAARSIDSSGTLRAYLVDLAAAIDGWARPGLRWVLAAAQHDTNFAERFRSTFLGMRHTAMHTAVTSELSDREAARRTADLIAASLWYNVAIVDRPLDAAWIDEMCGLVEATS